MTDTTEFETALTIDGTPVNVLRLELRDAVDEVGWLRCELEDGSGGPDPGTLVGKPLSLTVSHRSRGQSCTFAGYVVEADATTGGAEAERGTRIVARPRLFRLTQRASSRVFQDLTVREIATQVLEEAGIPATEQSWELSGPYPKRTYTTQYRESDLDFLQRLLGEEGIAFAVDARTGKDIITFFDVDLGDVEGEKAIPFRFGDGLNATHDSMSLLTQERSTAPGKVHLRDYDFERPQNPLDAMAEGEDARENALEVYVYPGRYTDPSLGDRYARVRLESLRARGDVVSGTTNTLRLLPGRKFVLEEHPYEPLNREYFVLSVALHHEARRVGARPGGDLGAGSRVEVRAIPVEVPYRSALTTPARAVPGAQLAVVTGAPGMEIDPDEHGRVTVLFPWDRLGKADDTSSVRIRTNQLPLGGGMLTPRTGWEVCTSFLEGDPDQPLVFGRLYNAKTPPPYPLPKNKARMAFQTSTTPGGGSTNELRMDDSAGSEELFLNASRDGAISVGNNATEDVGNNETRSIGSNHSLAVTDSMSSNVGVNQTLSIGGSQSIHVATFMVDDVGSHTCSIGGNRDLKAGGDHKRTVTGASTLTIGGLQVDLVAGSADDEGMATMDDTVGAALVEMTASSRTVTVKGARTESAGAAKVILAKGGRAVQVTGTLKQKVAGAILTKISSDRTDASTAELLDVAGGAQIVKATNVVFQAKSLLSVVMGGATLTMTPSSVTIAGAKITIDGECDETAALIKDN